MKQGKRIIGIMLAFVLTVAAFPMMPSLDVKAEETKTEQTQTEQAKTEENAEKEAKTLPKIRLSVGNGQETPQYKAGEKVTLTVRVENQGEAPANNVRITPVIDNAKDWPFEIQNMNEERLLDTIDKGAVSEAKWDWTVKADVEGKAYKTIFRLSYNDGVEEYKEDKIIYVKTTAAEQEKPSEGGGQKQEVQPPAAGELGGGEVFNSEPIVSGGGGSDNASVPRVIVTGFTTVPGVVNAGSDFTLTVHVKNTSTTTAVSNMLFDLQAPSAGTEAAAEAPAFLPVSGSSSIYLDRIPAGETRDISINMNARADLVQKPYSIAMSMKYEDSNATQFEGSSSLAVPVQQAARFEFSQIEIAPASIQVGEEANLTCSLYNTGRTKLYNVKVKFTGDGISAKDVFVGNVDSGATGTIDGMITGESEIQAGTKCKMVVTYEDEAGKVSTKEEEFELEVVPAVTEDMAMMSEAPVEEKGFPVIPVVIGAVVVAAVVTAILLVRRKKKKQAWAEEEELADEVDRFTEDE